MVSCTLRDVARAAGVSIATVSRVVNGVEHVSSATKSKVLVAISVLGYTPDIHALELSRRKREGRRIDRVKKFSANGGRQEVNSVLPVQALNDWRKAARVHVLEEENVRLRRLITNLSMDVEMWKRLAK
jgi:hypothetical protein